MKEEENRSRAVRLGVLALTCAACVGGVAAASSAGSSAFGEPAILGAATAQSHCASVHFGMDDATLTGDANLANSDVVAVGEHEGGIGVASGVTIVSHEVINQAVNAHANAGLKLSSAKKNSTIALTFAEEIVSCDVYAVGWKGDSCAVSVNGSDPEAVASSSSVTGTSLVPGVSYEKHHFDFQRTHTLTIAATKRVVIGDIALRVAE